MTAQDVLKKLFGRRMHCVRFSAFSFVTAIGLHWLSEFPLFSPDSVEKIILVRDWVGIPLWIISAILIAQNIIYFIGRILVGIVGEATLENKNSADDETQASVSAQKPVLAEAVPENDMDFLAPAKKQVER